MFDRDGWFTESSESGETHVKCAVMMICTKNSAVILQLRPFVTVM